MKRNSKLFFSRLAKSFGRKKKKDTHAGFPPELFLAIILFLDPCSLVKLVLSCLWLLHEISGRKPFWKECYYQEFSPDQDDYELKWLQQLGTQQRPPNSSATPADGEGGTHHAKRRITKQRKGV